MDPGFRDAILFVALRDAERHGGMGVVLTGLVVGSLISVGVAVVLRGYLYGISPLDPVAFASVGAILVLSAFAAMCGPAHRAARVDPALSLRSE